MGHPAARENVLLFHQQAVHAIDADQLNAVSAWADHGGIVRLCLLVLLSLLTTTSQPAEAWDDIVGAGAMKCSEIMARYRVAPKMMDETLLQWAYGFMTANNFDRLATFGKETDLGPGVAGPGAVRTWLYDYCVYHPDNFLIEGVQDFSTELRKRQGLPLR